MFSVCKIEKFLLVCCWMRWVLIRVYVFLIQFGEYSNICCEIFFEYVLVLTLLGEGR
jgi:hypothetical protein